MGNIFSIQLSCDTIITRCCDCVAGQAIYACKLEENLADLKTALDQLKVRRNDVMTEVNVSEQQNLRPLDEVRGWLSRTDTMITEVDALLTDGPEQIKKLCVGGCCSKNYKSTLSFSKIVARRLHDINILKKNGAFEAVARERPAAPVIERPSNSAIGLESLYNEVWSNIEGNHVGIIGLYGVGGVGKTRLLTEINNKIGVSCGGFDMVIWVVVSKVFYIGRVQDDIARRIGLRNEKWNDKTTDEKASDIFRVLKEKKFVMLLDDVWERVDLLKAGIPLPTQENGSKLIFTTRSLEVCGQMRAHKKIEVPCLPEEKAWELFEEHVGKDILNGHPNIPELAQEVARECGGLPLALITIGRAMACRKTPKEWKYAIEVLRRSANFVFPNMGEEVFPLLKFSYDSLPNDMVRSCFLYCSLFPEDYRIFKDRLIDRWIGEGFTDEHNNISQARNQGHHILGCLIHASLLEEVDDWSIKMHDVIRDMSLWIACKYEAEKWKFFVEAGYHLTEMPEVRKWSSTRKMSLMNNKIENLTESPNCPDLQSLFLDHNQLKVIHNDFFQYMCGLKVLSLRENPGIRELPEGISKLVSLEYLDISFTRDIRVLPEGISKLVSLEYLDISYTGIRQLPTELKALEKLKCLKLEYIKGGVKIPRGLISGFSKLQMLGMLGSFPFEEVASEDKISEWLAEEVQCLKHLNALSVPVTSAFALDSFLTAEMLHSCIQEIGLHSFRDSKQLNILSLANIKSLNLIHLDDCASLEEVKTEWEGEGRRMNKAPTQSELSTIATQPCFQSLESVVISLCSKLRDITWLIHVPNLRFLYVRNCNKMEEIFSERKLTKVAKLVGTSSPFAKLEFLYLKNLPELKSIYWDAQPFSCIKKIQVVNCPMLRRLPFNSTNTNSSKIRIMAEEKWWKEVDEDTRNAFPYCFIAT